MQSNFFSAITEAFASFLRKQFTGAPTRYQIIFDIIFGIIAPILCLIADPIVFQDKLTYCTNGPTDNNLLSPQRLAIFAYAMIGLGMLALLIWLIAWRYLASVAAAFAGIFFVGSELAIILGAILLPLSVIGLFVLIGIAGFTPFLTSFVYLRNGFRAWQIARQQEPAKPRFWLISIALAAMLVVFIVPAFIQQQAWVMFPQTRVIEVLPPCGTDP
jgi:hypothetical protein